VFSDPGQNGRKTTLVCLISEEENVETRLALVLTFELVLLCLVRREDDMASGDEKKFVAVAAFSHEEVTDGRSKRCGLGKDGETERVSKRVAIVYSWVGGEDGREELGTSRLGNGRPMDFDVDVGDVEFFKNVEALIGCGVGVFTNERFGLHPDPKDDGRGVSDLTNVNHVGAGPFDPYLM